MVVGRELASDISFLVVTVQQRETPRLVVSRNDDERLAIPVGKTQRLSNRPIEIHYFHSYIRKIICVAPIIHLRTFRHNEEARLIKGQQVKCLVKSSLQPVASA